MAEDDKKENSTITIKKQDLWKYSTFLLLAILIVGAFLYFNNNSSGSAVPSGNVVQNPGEQIPSQGEKVNVQIGDAPVLGSKTAKVTIVEFSDYECPFCGRHFQQTYPQLKKDYIDTGKAKLVFKDFPLSFHPQAQKAAEAARCAGEQGKYWEMHDKLFSNQESLSVENEKKWAKEIGLNSAKFDSCLDSGKYAGAVQSDSSYGQSIGVSGTPAFFINGKLISGAQPYSVFKQAIDAELAA